jgi:hypothetical protein
MKDKDMVQRVVPTMVKIATGNRGHQALPRGEPMPEGPPVMPDGLEGKEVELWNDLVRICFWLKEPDSYKMAAWCRLQADFMTKNWRKWSASNWQIWRVLGGELGLDPSSRARMGMVKRGQKAETTADKFFRAA